MRCPSCGAPVEDRGLCVHCWDREVHRDSQRGSHWNPGASWKPWLYERNFWIAEAKRQGAGLQEVMAVTGLSRRTVLHVWQQALHEGEETPPRLDARAVSAALRAARNQV